MRKQVTPWVFASLVVVLPACTTYYRVSDPSSGKAYYTTEVDDAGEAGAVKFTDKKTGSTVTLQSSEVKKISEKEYKASLGSSGK